MGLEVFRRLKPLRQLLAQGLLDHPPPREANEGLGLGQDQIAQHGETGGHPSGGGVGEQGQVEQPRPPVPLQGTGDFGHLHQAEHPFLHAGSPRGTHHHQGHPSGGGLLGEACELFPHHRAHGAPHEPEIHHPQGQGLPLQPTQTGHHGIFQACGLLGIPQTIGITAAILEGQRIQRGQVGVEGFKGSGIHQEPEPLLTVDAVVMSTALAHAGIGQQILAVHHQAAAGTFAPEPIPLIRLLHLIAAGNGEVFAAVSKPVEQGHGRRSETGREVGKAGLGAEIQVER